MVRGVCRLYAGREKLSLYGYVPWNDLRDSPYPTRNGQLTGPHPDCDEVWRTGLYGGMYTPVAMAAPVFL